MFGLFKKSKPVKIRSRDGNEKYGVAAKDVKELLKKSCKLLQVPVSGAHVSLYSDGTRVTQEFFTSLPDHADLVLLSKEETWTGAVCDIAHVLNTDQHADALIAAARGLLSDERSPRRRKLLSDLLTNLEDRSELESRDKDEEWFQGLDTRFKTKSAYMKSNCENRMRSYMKEVDEVRKNVQKPSVRAEFSKVSTCLVEMLKEARYNGSYFDRTEKELNRLCTREGWFTCQGSFDQDSCLSLHSINPYSSRESRIVFSTWNLDHGIEKRRTILPTLEEALQRHRSTDVDLTYFYRLLFTTDNLKLVHIACHKKGAHNLLCDPRRIYRGGAKTEEEKKKKRGVAIRAKKRRVT